MTSHVVGSAVFGALLAVAAAAEAGAGSPTAAASGADAYRHVVAYGTQAGLHRTGSPGGEVTAAWIGDELVAAGLTPATEEFAFPRFVPIDASLEVDGFRPEVFPFYYSGVTSAGGVAAELVDVGLGTPLDFALADVAGKIVLIDVPALQNAFVPTFEPALEAAHEAGAAAVVASIRGPLNHIAAQNSDARAGLCHLPVLIVGKGDAAELRLRHGKTATLVLDAEYHDGSGGDPSGRSANVVASIEGTGDDAVIVGTPYNGWFAAAAERGSGIGTFLTLARYFAERAAPPEQDLVFVATGGHEVGFLGLEQFIARHPDLVERAIAYVHLGATLSAKEYDEVAGTVVETGTPEETRSLFISENPLLIAIGETAMRTRPTGPMASVPPGVQNPGEQQFMYRVGVPIVSLSGGHLWFHTPGDLPFTTSAELLDPMVTAFREIIERLLTLDRDTVRAANEIATRLAARSSGTGPAVQRCQ